MSETKETSSVSPSAPSTSSVATSSSSKKRGLAFSLNNKRKKRKVLSKSALSTDLSEAGARDTSETGDSGHVTEVNTFDQAELAEAAATDGPVLVVPLIKQNAWAVPTQLERDDGDAGADGEEDREARGKETRRQQKRRRDLEMKQALALGDGEDSVAAKAILKELKEGKSNQAQALSEADAKTVPLLLQNEVPGIKELPNEKQKLQHDLSHRPDEPDLDSYKRMPIHAIGEAMLRGMNWKPGGNVGLSNAACVLPIEFLARPHRAGLGSTPLMPGTKRKNRIHPNESRDGREFKQMAPDADGKIRSYRRVGDPEEKVMTRFDGRMRLSSYVKIKSGQYKGEYAHVIHMGGRDAATEGGTSDPIKVKVEFNQQLLSMPKDQVEVANEIAIKAEKKRLATNAAAAQSASVSSSSSSSKRRREKDSRTTERERSGGRSREIRWVREGIKVRIVSKKLKKGKYYCKKGMVIDVVSRTQFNLRMDDGAFLDGVKEKEVETLIPKPGGRVRVLLGPHKGKAGTLVEKNTKKAIAWVQLDETMEQITCSYDKLSQLVDVF